MAIIANLIMGMAAWYLIYRALPYIATWLTFIILGLDRSGRFAISPAVEKAIWFFIFETPKVLMLLGLIVFVVGIIRTFFTPERTRQMLVGRSEFAGNVLAALLGIPTPFCSCSAVPLFMGFVQAGVPLGVTLSFLIAAPMVNEIALGMLFSMFGIKVAALYVATGLSIAILAGWVIGRLKMEKHVEEWVYEMQAAQLALAHDEQTWPDRIAAGTTAVREIVGKVWPYVLVGIAVGAGVHGYVPEDFMAKFMGSGVWWSVPAAVAIGVPMYSNAAAIMPVVQALLEKGASLGTVLAFMMAVIALSLPEMVILRKVLKMRLILTFVSVVAIGIMLVGYIFNAVLH
ncbi:MAG: permease [Armatimonadetes bacterium]|nr:permease [Armatimonadota bacterium]